MGCGFGLVVALAAPRAEAQLGGLGGGGAAGGAGAPTVEEKPRFREHVHSVDGLALRREEGDAIVGSVRVIGNRRIPTNRILQEIQTRKNRFYDRETVLADIRRLRDMGPFDFVTFEVDEQPDAVSVTFTVDERPVITNVWMHGNRALNDRELITRGGVNKDDPMSEFAIESARRRLIDYYHEEGFNQAAIETTIGVRDDPSAVVFRINEGPKERVSGITISGSTIVSEARLKKVIVSRGPMAGVIPYLNNTFVVRKINDDVKVLAEYYHDLGFLTATVGRHWSYDESGKWVTVHFVVNEGPRFTVNEIQIIGNQFVTEESIRERLMLKPGDLYDGKQHRIDVGEVVYGLGELGFAFAEVEPQTVMLDEGNRVNLVYQVDEGDRWRIADIRVNIKGDPHLMRESTMLNLVNLREGSWVNLRELEVNRSRLVRSQLFESNPQVADPPDIKLVPVGESGSRR